MFMDRRPKTTNEKESENPEERGMIDERISQNGKEWDQEHRRIDYPSSEERSAHPLKWKRRRKGWAQSQTYF